MDNSSPTPRVTQSKPKRGASITGIVMAVLSLALSGMGNFLIVAEPKTQPSPTASDVENQVGQAVGDATVNALGVVFAVPMLVGAFVVGAIAVIFLVWRLRKVRVMGAITSVIAVLLVAWSYSIAIGAFDLIKANPA